MIPSQKGGDCCKGCLQARKHKLLPCPKTLMLIQLWTVLSRFLSDDPIQSFMPYVVLLETDGGPDHNLRFLRNCILLLAAFLVGNMDKLVAVRRCLRHSYLNTVERCMSILNLGLTNLGMRVDFDLPDWLFDLLEGNGSMKKLREAIALYNSDLHQAIIQRAKMEAQKRMWDEIEGDDEGEEARMDTEVVDEVVGEADDKVAEEAEMDVDENGMYPEGYLTETFFDTWGWYEGEVTSNEGMYLFLASIVYHCMILLSTQLSHYFFTFRWQVHRSLSRGW